MSSKPTIVFIPGAWHTAECYYLVEPPLRANGYETLALTLPSIGAEPPAQSLDMDIEHIRSKVIPLLDEGKDVVVVVHSWGGTVGSSALYGLRTEDRRRDGKPGGVVAMVYLTSRMIPEGMSFSGGGGGKGLPQQKNPFVRVEGDYSYMIDPVGLFYHDVPKEIADKAVASLGRHHSQPTFHCPVGYEGYKHIPVTYLLCKQDRAIPFKDQEETIERAGITATKFVCDTAHSPFLIEPEFVARVIRHAARESDRGADWVYAGLSSSASSSV